MPRRRRARLKAQPTGHCASAPTVKNKMEITPRTAHRIIRKKHPISRSTLYRLIEAGVLPVKKFGGRYYLQLEHAKKYADTGQPIIEA